MTSAKISKLFLVLSILLLTNFLTKGQTINEVSLNQYVIPGAWNGDFNSSYTSLNYAFGRYDFAAFTFGVGIGFDPLNLGHSEVISPNFGIHAHTHLKNNNYLFYTFQIFGKLDVPEAGEDPVISYWFGLGYKHRFKNAFTITPVAYLLQFRAFALGLKFGYDFKARK